MPTIRHAARGDAPAIRRLIARYPKQLMSDAPPASRFFVAVENGVVVGCCALDVYSKRIAEIRSLAVDDAHRNSGLGTALVRACVAEAKRRQVKEVLAITGHPRLFERLGFGAFQGEKFAVFRRLRTR